MISLKGLDVEIGESAILRGVTADLEPGKVYGLTGPNGSGKSTLLRVLAGLKEPTSGTVAFTGPDGADFGGEARAALLYSDTTASTLLPDARSEILLGVLPEVLGLTGAEERVRDWVDRLGVGPLVRRATNVFVLSAGEQQIVALVAALAREPQLLLLDESTGVLDAHWVGRLHAVLREYQRTRPGSWIVHATHDPLALSECDALLDLEPFAVARPGRAPDGAPSDAGLPDDWDAPTSDCLMRVSDLELEVGRPARTITVDTFEVRQGDVVGICGGNGSGKTTVVEALAGWQRPARGSVLALRGLRMCLVTQRSDDSLCAPTVVEEVASGVRDVRGWRRESRVDHILELLRVGHLRGRDTLKLSSGEKRMVSIAACLGPRPQLLLMDEPFLGLDRPNAERVAGLVRLLAARGVATVFTAHRLDHIEALGARMVHLRPDTLTQPQEL